MTNIYGNTTTTPINPDAFLGGGNGQDIVIDQTFDPESENAQSGKAVAQAVANAGGGSGNIDGITIEDGVIVFKKPVKMTGGLNMDDTTIENVDAPYSLRDVVDKGYVDNLVGDIESLLGGI